MLLGFLRKQDTFFAEYGFNLVKAPISEKA